MGVFKLSLVDMIKKTRYNYGHPVDYMDVFISSTYSPGRSVDITLTDKIIEVRCSGPIDAQFLENLEKKKILALASVIPPTKEYENVELSSRGKRVCIGNDRQVSIGSCDAKEGLLLDICRMRNKDEAESKEGCEAGTMIDEEAERIRELYAGSDMRFTLNDEPLTPEKEHFQFDEAGFRGVISYNPYSLGGISYFVNGRRITSEDFLSGIDLCLHGHSLKHTLTKSRVLKRRGAGKREYEKLQQALPNLLLRYLQSGKIEGMRKESVSSYQTILRSVFRKYFENAGITGHVKKNILFANKTGQIDPKHTLDYAAMNLHRLPPYEIVLYEEIMGRRPPSLHLNDAKLSEYGQYCAGLQSMLRMPVQPTGGDKISYDPKRGIIVPIRLFDEQDLFEIGFLVANQIRLSQRKRLALYKNIARAYQG